MSIHPYQEDEDGERLFVEDRWDRQVTLDELVQDRYVAKRERFYDPEPRELRTFNELDDAIEYLEEL